MKASKTRIYQEFLVKIKEKIKSAQYEALKAVNKELISLYWDIGKSIIEEQKKHGWGKSIVENLASDLQKEYPGIKGFSAANIWRMRNFYSIYGNNIKLAPMVREISWAKNILIMEKCKDDLEKEFYIIMTKKFGWTKNVLIHQIENKSFEKQMLSQTNFNKSVPAKYANQAKLAVKDEYTFDFLELGKEHSEKELENSLTGKIKSFLSEMGSFFCFIGSQYRIEINEKEYFVDLLLYHRKLKCLVAIELKIGEFLPEYIGKMQFYLSVLDEKVRLDDELPSIGLIICKNKDKTVVEYALRDARKPIGVATYKISHSLPKKLSPYFPSKEQITKRLNELENNF